MAGTFDFVILQFAIFEGAVIMSAEIGDGIIVVIDVKDHNGFFLELDPEANRKECRLYGLPLRRLSWEK
jgi:hypothetical protein